MNKAMGLQAYNQRLGHDIDGVRPVMIPSDDGVWFSRSEVELAFRSNGMTDEDKQQIVEEYNAAMCASNEAGYAGITAAETIRYLIQRAKAAEAEIARRDAAAGEAVAWRYAFLPSVGDESGWKYVESEDLCNGSSGYVAQPLYTTPPAASVPDALREAVNAIFFNDSSDYLSALWSVVRALSPETADLFAKDERAAFEMVNANIKHAAAPAPGGEQ